MPELTESQKQAVSGRGGSVLLSAAAGSGKTFTLTQRIISLIMDGSVSVDRLCVVTFTRAAAAELKDRITAALNSAVSEAVMRNDRPAADRLRHQMSLLQGARISTIDSYCYDLVKRNFDSLALETGIHIADSAEISMIHEAAMDNIFDYFSEEDDDAFECFGGFGGFIDIFSKDRDDNAKQQFISLYQRLKSFPQGVSLLDGAEKMCADAAEKGFKGSVWDKQIRDDLAGTARYYRSVCADALEYFSSASDEKPHAYYQAFSDDLDIIEGLIGLVEGGAELGKIFKYISGIRRFTYLGRLKKDQKDDFCEYYKEIRGEYKEWLKPDGKYGILAYTPETVNDMLEKTVRIIRGTSVLLKKYSDYVDAEKLKRGIMDFSDIEHLALRLLYNDDLKTLSETAAEESERYDEIFIDEYQDVNELQDMIFRAVSCRSNRFMVGDIKQSIYGFRGAMPEIFAHYRNLWKENSPGAGGRAIFMRDNFRCGQSIISSVNAVCGRLLKNSSTGYLDEDDLVYASRSEHPLVPVKIRIFNSDDLSAASDNESGDGDVQNTKLGTEAYYVAGEIKKLLESGSCRPCDIAILLRSAKDTAQVFSDALSKAGIRSYNAASGGFFETPEIQLMRCLLNAVDSSFKDRYLVGVLRSPLYGFSVNDLVKIRYYDGAFSEKKGKRNKSSRSISFIKSMRLFIDKSSENGSREDKALAARCAKFMSDIRKWRRFSRMHPVYDLIFKIYRETGILSFGANGSTDEDKRLAESRRANMMRLYDLAREYEGASFKGLYSFIDYIEKSVNTSDERSSDEIPADSIQIMTVHASKGLEFPVVFICNTAKLINQSDSKEPLILDTSALENENLGISVRIPDPTYTVRFETPMYWAASLKRHSASIDEEIRMLYVAMTRAKDRLYITGTMSDPEKKLGRCMMSGKYLSKALLSRQNCWLKWIMTAVGDVTRSGFIEYAVFHNIDEVRNEIGPQPVSAAGKGQPEITETRKSGELRCETDRLVRIFGKRFDFVYPYDHSVRLPAKVSVSRLFPGILDIENDEDGPVEPVGLDLPAPVSMPEPEFIINDRPAEEAGGAERGTATHVFMQFCDFDKVESGSPESEAQRLVDEFFITPRMASLIEFNRVKAFFHSDIYREMRSSRMMKRELRFNAFLPAAHFTNNPDFAAKLKDENLLVQGVIDCLYENADGSLTLVDYKTDHFPGASESAAEAKLVMRHMTQLNYYREALAFVSRRTIRKTLIYSFWLGKTVEIP